MKIALGIFRLQPAGGLERNALKLAELLAERGHRVVLHTTVTAQLRPPGVEIVTVKRTGVTNHAAMKSFSARFAAATRDFDLVVGFQRFEGLDVLYCADWCFVDRPRPSWQRMLPRYRTMAALERACFARESATRIIALAAPQLTAYVRAYGTPPARLAILPPTIEASWRPSLPPSADRRASLRARHGLAERETIWLWVGLQPQVKGLDRVMAALARRPEARLMICGVDRTHRQVIELMAPARRVGLAERIKLFGLISDHGELRELFETADLLIHPARLDVTGTVILEAIVSGLPVIATANCGYSPHVSKAGAGIVLPDPFEAAALDQALVEADAARRSIWSTNAQAYGRRPDLYLGLTRATDLIEAAGQASDAAWVAAGGLKGPISGDFAIT